MTVKNVEQSGYKTANVVNSMFTVCVCSFGSKHVTPRTLTSQFLGNMVCVEGIVTKSRFTY